MPGDFTDAETTELAEMLRRLQCGLHRHGGRLSPALAAALGKLENRSRSHAEPCQRTGPVSPVDPAGFAGGHSLTTADVARRYGISPQTVRQSARRGSLSGTATRSGWLFAETDVNDWRNRVAAVTGKAKAQYLQQLHAELEALEEALEEALSRYCRAEQDRDLYEVQLAKLGDVQLGRRGVVKQLNDARERLATASDDLARLRQERGQVNAELGDADRRQRDLHTFTTQLAAFRELDQAREDIARAVDHIRKSRQITSGAGVPSVVTLGLRELERKLGPGAGSRERHNLDVQVDTALTVLPATIRELESEAG